jgi:hypothetical protein
MAFRATIEFEIGLRGKNYGFYIASQAGQKQHLLPGLAGFAIRAFRLHDPLRQVGSPSHLTDFAEKRIPPGFRRCEAIRVMGKHLLLLPSDINAVVDTVNDPLHLRWKGE